MARGTTRRALLASAASACSAGLAGCSLHDPTGDVLLTVYNHRESAVTVAVEIEHDSEVVFSQTVSLSGNPEEHPGAETRYALRDVENGERLTVRTAIDGSERYTDHFTMECAGDPDLKDRISINISVPDVDVVQNRCS